MPIRSQWSLAREGITGDTVARLISLTALNPMLTLPLLLLARYTTSGSNIARDHSTVFKHLKTLLTLGVVHKLNSWLNDAVTNNFSKDEYVWEKEVVVVTGGSDGIGKLIVGLLAERGIKVAVVDVQEPTYELQPTVSYFPCDLSSPTSITTTASKITSTHGAPTILINNAGVARGKTILTTTPTDLSLTFGVNTFSHYHLARAFLPAMISSNHGMIVTIASLAGYVTAPKLVDYAASKAAAISFHEGLTAELVALYGAPKVRTVLMCQGYTRTALFEGFGGKSLWAETVAEEVVRAVLGGRSRVLVLPEVSWGVAPKLRGWPVWLQTFVRRRLDNMSGWKGRQVVQPSLVGEGEERGEEGEKVGGSTVLVEGE
ncbi:short chain dehydrogenase/reductase family protein-like protein [Plenodomus tracheiphilus IPT5]|uniref:Short-chain dehydrogenase/reductase 3 n=1 Tax=Plenodomus tracheiphilus IPT5 TaxID=1408161 RepID=A0A6A7BF09_9PLEO|nr:short chain dehydrogenase/reductase family protein-like protein [Plenodomus tracheiphilus IPT5]